MNVPFRLVIEGEVPVEFIPTLVKNAANTTPVDGGYRLSVGSLTDHTYRISEEQR